MSTVPQHWPEEIVSEEELPKIPTPNPHLPDQAEYELAMNVSLKDMSLESFNGLRAYLSREDIGAIRWNRTEIHNVLHPEMMSLRSKDSYRFGPMSAATQQHILKSFRACLSNTELGDVIVSLAKEPGTDAIFEAYAELLDEADRTATLVYNQYKQTHPDTTIEVSTIYAQFLKTANTLLTNAQSNIVETRRQYNITHNTIHHTTEDLAEFVRRSVSEELINDQDVNHFRESKRQFLVARQQYLDDTSTLHEKEVAKLLQQLQQESVSIRGTRALTKALPRDERAKLKLEQLSDIKLHGPILGADLGADPYYSSIMQTVQRFPKGDQLEFLEILGKKDSYFYYSTCNGKLLGMFNTQQMKAPLSERTFRYIDWYSANPDAAISGLAEATLLTQCRQHTLGKDMYAVVAPHVASSTTVIERMGCVAFGPTNDGEYGDLTYLRVRNIEEDYDEYDDVPVSKYAGKILRPEDVRQVRLACNDSKIGELQKVAVLDGTRTVHVCPVEFKDRSHLDQVNADTDDGHVYRAFTELQERYGGKWVLSRYIPHEENTKALQRHYCVFERECLPEDAEQELNDAIKGLH